MTDAKHDVPNEAQCRATAAALDAVQHAMRPHPTANTLPNAVVVPAAEERLLRECAERAINLACDWEAVRYSGQWALNTRLRIAIEAVAEIGRKLEGE